MVEQVGNLNCSYVLPSLISRNGVEEGVAETGQRGGGAKRWRREGREGRERERKGGQDRERGRGREERVGKKEEG